MNSGGNLNECGVTEQCDRRRNTESEELVICRRMTTVRFLVAGLGSFLSAAEVRAITGGWRCAVRPNCKGRDRCNTH